MNIWLKSLLIGAVAAGLTFLVNKKYGNQNRKPLYTANLTVEVVPDKTMGHGETIDAMVKLPAIIKRRCEAAGYSVSMKALNESTQLEITIKHVDDVLRATNLMTRNGKLEFWEIYTLNEIPFFWELFKKQIEDESAPSPDIIKPADSTRSLIIGESSPAPPKKPKEFLLDTLVKFPNAEVPELGAVYEKDTALLNSILKRQTALEKFPPGIKFCYGPGDNYFNKSARLLSIYGIRTYGHEKAMIGNSDIKSVSQDYSHDGRPEVIFKFYIAGARKWEELTRKNSGKFLAISLDNMVITAPKVNEAITDGSASIGGGFTIDEAQILANQLNSGYLSATIKIIKTEASPETMGLNPKLILIMVGVFVLATGLALLVFNALKNR